MAKTAEEYEKVIALYENNGATRLFYALNRKLNEMADMLNKSTLSNLDLTDAKDKTFERLKVVWNDAASIATAVKMLGETAGVTGDESKDILRSRKMVSPESVAQEIGDYKTQDV